MKFRAGSCKEPYIALISNPEPIILDEPESFLDKNFESETI